MLLISCSLGDNPSPAVVQGMVQGLADASLAQMREVGGLPSLYSAGIRYVREPYRRERWQTALETLARKVGDCEDLAAYLCAQLNFGGVPARVHCYAPRPRLIHCVVQLPNGSIEDPSKKLGMRGKG